MMKKLSDVFNNIEDLKNVPAYDSRFRNFLKEELGSDVASEILGEPQSGGTPQESSRKPKRHSGQKDGNAYLLGQFYEVDRSADSSFNGYAEVDPIVWKDGKLLISKESDGKRVWEPVDKHELIVRSKDPHSGCKIDDLTFTGVKMFAPVTKGGRVVEEGLPAVESYIESEGSIVPFKSSDFRLRSDEECGHTLRYTGIDTNPNRQNEDTIEIPPVKHCDYMFYDVPYDDVCDKIKMPNTIRTADHMFSCGGADSLAMAHAIKTAVYFCENSHTGDEISDRISSGWYMPEGCTCLGYTQDTEKIVDFTDDYGYVCDEGDVPVTDIVWYGDRNGNIHQYIPDIREDSCISRDAFCDIVLKYAQSAAYDRNGDERDEENDDFPGRSFNHLCVTDSGLNMQMSDDSSETLHDRISANDKAYDSLFYKRRKHKSDPIFLGDLAVQFGSGKPCFVSQGHTADGKNFSYDEFKIGRDVKVGRNAANVHGNDTLKAIAKQSMLGDDDMPISNVKGQLRDPDMFRDDEIFTEPVDDNVINIRY